ncbi:MAG: thioredoxin domain-containing protein [Patescibacteria group bacterium]
MKKTFRNLILIAIVVVAALIILAVVWGQPKKKTVDDSTNILSVKDAQAQSYAVDKQPVLRKDDRISGSKNAPLQIFVYEDYASPLSAALAETLQKIQAESGDKVAVIVRSYVLKGSALSRQSALAVDCADEEGKWLEMRTALFALAKQRLIAGDFVNYAKQIGLNEEKFSACLTNEEKSGKIEQLAKENEDYKIQGSPTIFVGDEMIPGARPYEDFIDSNGDKIEGLKSLIARKLNSQ